MSLKPFWGSGLSTHGLGYGRVEIREIRLSERKFYQEVTDICAAALDSTPPPPDAGKVTAELAKAHAESEFEKYRIVQDRLFESDFDRIVKQFESAKR